MSRHRRRGQRRQRQGRWIPTILAAREKARQQCAPFLTIRYDLPHQILMAPRSMWWDFGRGSPFDDAWPWIVEYRALSCVVRSYIEKSARSMSRGYASYIQRVSEQGSDPEFVSHHVPKPPFEPRSRHRPYGYMPKLHTRQTGASWLQIRTALRGMGFGWRFAAPRRRD